MDGDWRGDLQEVLEEVFLGEEFTSRLQDFEQCQLLWCGFESSMGSLPTGTDGGCCDCCLLAWELHLGLIPMTHAVKEMEQSQRAR